MPIQCPKSHVWSESGFPVRESTHKFHIHPRRVTVCVLHLVERITEFLLIRSITTSNEDEIRNRVCRLPGFNLVKIDADDPMSADHPDFVEQRTLYLTGNQANTLSASYLKVFCNSNQQADIVDNQILDIWKYWNKIRKGLQTDVFKGTFTISKLEQLQPVIVVFDKVVTIWASGRTSLYLHILKHHIVSELRLKNLIEYSNQGVESANNYYNFLLDRTVGRAVSCTGSASVYTNNFFNAILGVRSV